MFNVKKQGCQTVVTYQLEFDPESGADAILCAQDFPNVDDAATYARRWFPSSPHQLFEVTQHVTTLRAAIPMPDAPPVAVAVVE